MMPLRPLPRRRQLLALEPRLLLDAAAAATAAKVADASAHDSKPLASDTVHAADAVVVAPTATTPGVSATGGQPAITIAEGSGAQSVDLFSAVSVSSDQNGQALQDLVITVDRSGANQALLIDGTTVTLTETDLPGITAGHGYAYTVRSSGSITTVTVFIDSSESDANTPADVATLIDGLGYRTLDDQVASGSVKVTLVSLSDVGDGTNDGEVATLGIAADVSISNSRNAAPELSDAHPPSAAERIGVEALGDNVEVVYGGDGQHAYAAGDGTIGVFTVDASGRLSLQSTQTVDGMGRASQLAISADGRSLYALDGSSTIYAFSVGSDGKLGQASQIASGNGQANGGLAISDDGAYVYVGTDYNDVVIFRRDGNSGALTQIGRADKSDGRSGVITTVGDHVYVSYIGSGETLVVYQRNSNGSLRSVASLITSDATNYSPVDYQLVVSKDGQYIYVGDPDDGTLAVYRFSAEQLTSVESQQIDDLSALALSADGSRLYASSSDGTLRTFTIAGDGKLQLSSSADTGNAASDLALSADGRSMLLGGSDSVARYTLAQRLDQGGSKPFADAVSLSDSNADALAAGSGNYNGFTLRVSADLGGGRFDFIAGNGLSRSGEQILLNGSAIAGFVVAADGSLSVNFIADTTTQLANQVLHQLSYGNDQASAGSLITLSLRANDGREDSSAVQLLLRVNGVPQLNDALASGYALDKAISETDYHFSLDRNLFQDADGDALSWSVSGLPEGLHFDPATLALTGQALSVGKFNLVVSVRDASGASASLTLTLEVEQIGNRAPTPVGDAPTALQPAISGSSYSVSVDGLFNDADLRYGDTLSLSVAGLPDGLRFDASTLSITGHSSALGDHAVTLTATDESGASTQISLTLRVISQGEADNTAPTLQTESSALRYHSDGALSGFDHYVNDIELSADGRTLTIAASSAQNGGGDSRLYVYRRDTVSGALTLLQTFVQGTVDDHDASNGIEVDGLQGVTSFNYSADGKSLYLSGYTSTGSGSAYSIIAFGVAEDGSLSATGNALALSQKVLQLSVAADGNTVYALSEDSVHAIHIDEQGHLSLLAHYQPGAGYLSLGKANSLQLDADGNLYVLGDSRLTVYASAADGSLHLAGQLSRDGSTLTWTNASAAASVIATLENSNAFSGANALAVSADGLIHLTTSNGFLTTLRFDASGNTLAFVSEVDAYTALNGFPHGLTLSADGSTLYVSGASSSVLTIYAVGADGKPTLSHTVDTGAGISRLVVSADGKSLYGGKDRYFGTVALSQLSADQIAQDYTAGDTSTPLRPITLVDAQSDALDNGQGNYQGASLTLQRSDGVNSADQFGFVAGNGLSLVDGQILLDGKAIARFSSADGKLSLSFTAAISSATANQVLDQISYRNTSVSPGQSLNLSLSVSDQYGKSDQLRIALSVPDVNDAPSVTATPSSPTYIGNDQSVPLFTDVTVSTGEPAQSILQLELSISGLKDGIAERLTLGDSFVNLTDGMTASVQLQLAGSNQLVGITVTVVDGSAKVVLSSEQGWSAEATAALIQSLGYSNNSSDYSQPISEGTRTVTLTSIRDNGGSDHGGSDTGTLNLASVVSVEAAAPAIPPTIEADGADARYSHGDAAADLFSGVGVGGSHPITAINLALSGLRDGDNEQLLIDGSVVALIHNVSGSTANGIDYYIEIGENGTATVYLSSSAGLDSAAAAALIDGLGYDNASSQPSSGERSITLSTVMDSNNAISEPGITAQVAVVVIEQAPILDSHAGQPHYAAADAAAATLFSGTTIDPIEAGQQITALRLSISGVRDDNEQLWINGSRVRLVDGANGSTAGGYRYQISLSDGIAQINLDFGSAGIGANAAATLIDGLGYANASTQVSQGERVVTLSRLSDSGGASSDSTISARVDVVNSVPQTGPGQADLPSANQNRDYHATLPTDWFVDADGERLHWRIDGLPEGLRFDPESLTISGVAGQPGNHDLLITVSDRDGASASRSLTLVVDSEITPTVPISATPMPPVSADPHPLVSDEPFTASLSSGVSAPLVDAAGRIGEPFGYASLRANAAQLLDALIPAPDQARLHEPLSLRLDDGRSSPLLTLAADGSAASVRSSVVSGRWSYDPASHRLLFQLPDGLFRSDRAIASLSLRERDGQPAQGVRLDLEHGRLIAAADRGVGELQLVLRSVDGQQLVVTLRLEPATRLGRAGLRDGDDDLPTAAGKPGLAELLHQHAASDLLTQAHALLTQLGDDGVTAEHHVASLPTSDLATQP